MALIKEMTGGFLPDKNSFYVNFPPNDVTEIAVAGLKAIFFLKNLEAAPHIITDKETENNAIPGFRKMEETGLEKQKKS